MIVEANGRYWLVLVGEFEGKVADLFSGEVCAYDSLQSPKRISHLEIMW